MNDLIKRILERIRLEVMANEVGSRNNEDSSHQRKKLKFKNYGLQLAESIIMDEYNKEIEG